MFGNIISNAVDKHYSQLVVDWFEENVNVEGENEIIKRIEFAEKQKNIIIVRSVSSFSGLMVERLFTIIDYFTIKCNITNRP